MEEGAPKKAWDEKYTGTHLILKIAPPLPLNF